MQVKAPAKKSVLLLSRQSDEPMQAIILAVGDKVESPLFVGDMVLLGAFAGHKMTGGTDDEPYLLLSEKEVLGILVNEP